MGEDAPIKLDHNTTVVGSGAITVDEENIQFQIISLAVYVGKGYIDDPPIFTLNSKPSPQKIS